ncbi:MAG: hypothetical protein ACM3ST_06800, partial [Bdellovibrio bacteriovorus]
MSLARSPSVCPDRDCAIATRSTQGRERWRLGLLGALLVFGVALAADDPEVVIERRERDLQSLKQQVEVLSKDLIDRNAERQTLIAELEERERDVAALALAGRELSRL